MKAYVLFIIVFYVQSAICAYVVRPVSRQSLEMGVASCADTDHDCAAKTALHYVNSFRSAYYLNALKPMPFEGAYAHSKYMASRQEIIKPKCSGARVAIRQSSFADSSAQCMDAFIDTDIMLDPDTKFFALGVFVDAKGITWCTALFKACKLPSDKNVIVGQGRRKIREDLIGVDYGDIGVPLLNVWTPQLPKTPSKSYSFEK